MKAMMMVCVATLAFGLGCSGDDTTSNLTLSTPAAEADDDGAEDADADDAAEDDVTPTDTVGGGSDGGGNPSTPSTGSGQAADGDDADVADECSRGSATCECYADFSCDAGLECDLDNICKTPGAIDHGDDDSDVEEDGPVCEMGSERCECYGNGTCDLGFVCLSSLCVQPPPEEEGDDDVGDDDVASDDDATGDDDLAADDDSTGDDDIAADDDTASDDDVAADDDATGDDDVVADDDTAGDDDTVGDDDSAGDDDTAPEPESFGCDDAQLVCLRDTDGNGLSETVCASALLYNNPESQQEDAYLVGNTPLDYRVTEEDLVLLMPSGFHCRTFNGDPGRSYEFTLVGFYQNDGVTTVGSDTSLADMDWFQNATVCLGVPEDAPEAALCHFMEVDNAGTPDDLTDDWRNFLFLVRWNPATGELSGIGNCKESNADCQPL